ncbi:hypothetical protein ABGB12_28375 [Actinocorallia sp. B10E7]|uniref:hypothetical protein n=1 Tax=Actinocorallia sp. B10E7 TaxID=3153558 RepID=UPI00325EA24D
MPRVAAAQFSAVQRLLFEETLHRTVQGQDNDGIARTITAYACIAFGNLEPSLADYAVR